MTTHKPGMIITTKSKGEKFLPANKIDALDLSELRIAVRETAGMIDKAYISQAVGIWKIFKSGIWQSQWGFLTWRDYINGDVGISDQRDQRLRRIAKVFIEYMKVDKGDLQELGFYKAFILCPLIGKKFQAINQNNVNKWIKYAIKCSARSLDFAVGQVKDIKKTKQVTLDALVNPPDVYFTEKPEILVDSGVKVTEGEPVTGPLIGPSVTALVGDPSILTVDEQETETKTAGASPEDLFNLSGIELVEQIERLFKLYPDQDQVVQAAIDKMKQTTESESDGYNLELICAELLATSPTQFKSGPTYIKFILDTLAKIHGGKFVHYKDGDQQSEYTAENHPSGEIEEEIDEGDVPF